MCDWMSWERDGEQCFGKGGLTCFIADQRRINSIHVTLLHTTKTRAATVEFRKTTLAVASAFHHVIVVIVQLQKIMVTYYGADPKLNELYHESAFYHR